MNIKGERAEGFGRIAVPESLWRRTWAILRDLGAGQNESACVWGGTLSGGRLVASKAYPIAEEHGVQRGCLSHRMSTAGVARLFAELRADGLAIVADVHTHPEDWVGLSKVDKEHPIEYRPGLVCLVLPHYASVAPSFDMTGVHIYLGGGEWFECPRNEFALHVEVI